jgi:hypothetical protein
METNWGGYVTALGANTHPVPSVALYPTTDSSKCRTGFQDLTPANPGIQARYDAMQPTWEGVTPTNRAVIQGLFSTEPAPVDKTLSQRK